MSYPQNVNFSLDAKLMNSKYSFHFAIFYVDIYFATSGNIYFTMRYQCSVLSKVQNGACLGASCGAALLCALPDARRDEATWERRKKARAI